jgi:hypothetical protein
LCPATYHNYIITAHQYQSMASTLYQKLQSPEVIPRAHSDPEHYKLVCQIQ